MKTPGGLVKSALGLETRPRPRRQAAAAILNDDVAASPASGKRKVALIRVLPISGVNPLEHDSLQTAIDGALNPTTPTTPDLFTALNLTSAMPVIDNNGNDGLVLVFTIDAADNLAVSQAAPAVGGDNIMYLYGGPTASTATLFDSSGNPGTLISPANGTELTQNTEHTIILQRSDGTFYKLLMRFTQTGYAEGDAQIDALSGFNCGTSQSNCP